GVDLLSKTPRDFNRAQFKLCRDLGQPAHVLAILSAVKNETSPRSRIRQNAGYLTQFPPHSGECGYGLLASVLTARRITGRLVGRVLRRTAVQANNQRGSFPLLHRQSGRRRGFCQLGRVRSDASGTEETIPFRLRSELRQI